MNPYGIDSCLWHLQQLIYELLTLIFNDPLLQVLESLWAGLKRITSDQHISLSILTIPKQQLLNPDVQSQLHHLLYQQRFNTPGGIPISLLAFCHSNTLELEAIKISCKDAFTTVIGSHLLNRYFKIRERYDFETTSVNSSALYEDPIFLSLVPSETHIHESDKHLHQLYLAIITTRFIHCTKILLRDAIGRFDTINQFEQFLQQWILGFCSQINYRNNYPLESAAITLHECSNKNSYHCDIQLKLHQQASITDLKIPFKLR